MFKASRFEYETEKNLSKICKTVGCGHRLGTHEWRPEEEEDFSGNYNKIWVSMDCSQCTCEDFTEDDMFSYIYKERMKNG